MADLALRAYVKEIDDLVEHEQLDEAIAHSRHILETYPKHLDTYRLLGKAYLEAKRYGDAADLFQRVLSAIPDDFVAHIGMSIVREDEGNLDASIWHMERAFETNPANPAIQQELRRLIGKRDGLEPHKVRLTRGALARMYAHGELFPQAIAELRSALQEDPDRPDLQVLLVSLYWRTDQKDQAAEVARQILEKLPFCREANRIVAGSLQAGGKAEEAAPFHRRLASLDPYAAFIETAMTDPTTVDAGSVHLQKLEWRPGHPVAAPEPARPTWTDSLGAGLRAEPKPAPVAGPLPSWLSEEPAAAAAPSPAPAPVAPPPPPAEEAERPAVVHPFAGAKAPPADIPPWMREAGWAESTGEAVEGPVSFSDEELSGAPAPAGEGELAPADIPDWLRDIAPPAAEEAGAAAPRAGAPDWLAGVAADSEAEAPTPPSPEPPTAAKPSRPGERGEVPTWLEEPSPGATETIVTWLGDRSARSATSGAPTPAEPPADQPVPEAEQPSWLTEPVSFEEEPAEALEKPAEGPPSWLSGVAEAAASDRPAMAEPPSWVTEEPPDEAIDQEIVERASVAGAAPDWLRAIAEPGEAAPSSSEGEPDWLAGLSSAASAAASVAAQPAEPSGPEWLRGIGEPEEQPTGPTAEREAPDWLRGLSGAAAETPSAAGPDWLSGLAPSAPPATASSLGGGAGIDWLRGIGEPESGGAGPAAGIPTPPKSWTSPEPSAPAVTGGEDDWLRGLADLGPPVPEAEAPASEPWMGAEEPVEPSAIAGETPDWLGRLAASQAEPPPSTAGQPSWLEEVTSGETAAASQESDWPTEAAVPSRPAIPEPVADDWLKGLLDDTAMPEEPAAMPGGEEPDWFAAQPVAEGAPDISQDIRGTATGWLREATEQTPPPDAEASVPTPDWLREFEAAGTSPPTPGEPTVVARRGADRVRAATPESPIESMDASTAGELGEDDVQKWLEALASRQEGGPRGEIEEAPVVPTTGFPPPAAARPAVPEEPEEGIEWLEQMAGRTGADESPRGARPSWQPLDQEPVAPVPEVPAAAEGEEEEVPDWLRSLAAEGEVAGAVEAEEEPAGEGLGWLQTGATTTVSARPPVQPPPPPAPVPAAARSDEEGPAWLRIPAATEPPSEGEPGQPPAAAPDEAPDWLRVRAAAEQVQDIEAEPTSEADETPYWLRKAAASEAQTARLYAEEETGGVPDWLKQAADAEAAPPAAEPVWSAMDETEDRAARPTPTEPEPPAAPEPSWLRPSEPIEPKPPVAAESEIVVPEWLRAPVEQPAPPPVPAASAEVPLTPVAPVVALPPQPPEVPMAPPVPPARPAEPVQAPTPMVPAMPVMPTPTVPAPPSAQVQAPAPPPAEMPSTPKPPKTRTTARTPAETLSAARQALASDDTNSAAKLYTTLVRRRSLVDDVIVDLKVAVQRLPDSAELWQALGDAYMKADLPTEAVEAYRHGLANL